MMAQGNHHQRLITTWHGVSNPDIEEAPTKAGWPTGASKAWVLEWRGDPPRRYRITASRPRYGDTVGNR